MQGTNRSGEGREEPATCICDPESELRLGRRENRRGEKKNGTEKKKEKKKKKPTWPPNLSALLLLSTE